YRYPPLFLLLFLPVWILPQPLAVYFWYWLNLAAVYLTGRVVAGELKQAAQGTAVKISLILLISFIAVFKYLWMSIRYGNVHLIVVCLLFGAFYFVFKQKDKTAGLLLALAISIKVFPVLTLPYFFIQKKWRFLAVTIGFVFVFNLIPAFYFGFGTNLKLLGDWYRHVIVESEFHDSQGPLNFSLKGQMQRTFTQIDYPARIADSSYQNINLFSLKDNQVNLLWKLAVVFFMVSTLFILWSSSKSPPDNLTEKKIKRLSLQEFGLMICTMLLVEPYTGTMYFTALFLPLAVLVYSVLTEESQASRIHRFALGFILFANCFLPIIPGSDVQRFILVLGLDFYITLYLWCALAYNLLRTRNKHLQFEFQPISI
ncbi:MAG: glycosyltransferase family 87 protein, partial [Pyrinomonadaceae bacterium]